MSLKTKMVVVVSAASALSLATVSIYAGGPETITTTLQPVILFMPYVYLGIGLGGAASDWQDFIFGNGSDDEDDNINVNADGGGFVFGGKLGYQATDHFGIEMGGYDLPDSNIKINFGPQFHSITGEIDSWFVYVAGTIRAAMFNPNFHVMGKVGGAYRNLNHTGDFFQFSGEGNGGYGTVMFGAGVDYDLQAYNWPLLVGVEYMLVPGTADSFASNNGIDKNAAPNAHVAVATLTYRFTI